MTLPKGWIECTFEEVASYIQRGKSPKYIDQSELAVINQKSIRWNGIKYEDLKYVHPEQWSQWPEERYAKYGDILWNSTGTGTIGRACLIEKLNPEFKYVIDSHVTILRFPSDIIPKYAFYWIMSPVIQQKIESMQTGTTNQVELGKKAIQETAFPLSPLNEQKRIVAKLETILAKVQSAQTHLDTIPGLLKRTRQAILSAAVSGKLTEDWRHEHPEKSGISFIKLAEKELIKDIISSAQTIKGFPSVWLHTSFINLCSKIADVDHKMPKEKKDGIPYISTKDFKLKRTIDFDNAKRISKEDYDALSRKIVPEINDILLSRYGTIGEVRRVEVDFQFQASYSIAIIKPLNNIIFSKYIELILQSNYLQIQIAQHVRATSQPDLGLKHIRELLIPVCSLEEQQEIVRRVEALFQRLDRIEAAYAAARQKVDAMAQTALAKAFRGELVPQDPTDEPASLLLARIQAERAASSKTAKPRQTRQPKQPAALVP